jgi:pimeloyl-ACP methyl ester carboxylesterase
VRPTQRARFIYFQVFRTPVSERLLSAGNSRVLRTMLSPIGDRADRYVEAMRDPARLTGGLNWYRGLNGKDLAAVGTITVPTTYIWSDRDGVVARTAALRTRDWMDGDYQLVVLRGISHWVPEQAPGPVADAILARINGAREA